MDNGIFGLAMYGALKRDDVNYIETKKGRVTLAELVSFYEEHVEEHNERGTEKETQLQKQREVESVPKTKNGRTKKRRPNNEKETL